jgi:hypothetical protein
VEAAQQVASRQCAIVGRSASEATGSSTSMCVGDCGASSSSSSKSSRLGTRQAC